MIILFGFLVATTIFGLALFLLAGAPWRTVGIAIMIGGLLLTIVVFLHFGQEPERDRSRTTHPPSPKTGGAPSSTPGGFGPRRIKDILKGQKVLC